MGAVCEPNRWRAPSENGGALIDPPPASVAELLAENVAAIERADCDVSGKSLRQLAAQARGELLAAAWQYTRTYRDVERPDPQATPRVFVAGHQPQLFHPGVWFKNFALSALAQRHRAVAVNLAIDSDTIKTASLRVPTGSARAPRVDSVPFDRQTAEIPYEERRIIDRESLSSFGARGAETIAPLVADPLLRSFWPLVQARAAETNNLGECIAQARHQQEGQWGVTTLELPQSRVCSLPAFNWFACHLLAHLPRLWEAYNRSVADYRRVNHVRSAAHPVPDLAMEDDWLEAPFWIWTKDNPARRRLFVRQRGDEIVLSDRAGLEHALWLQPEADVQRGAAQLEQLAAAGVRLRTRALITTLFARLCLGDVFLHGIGGAKYDRVTDMLVDRFFGLSAPCYLTLTATLRLPVASAGGSPAEARDIDARLRDLEFHPEAFLDGHQTAESAALVAEKRRWIEAEPARASAKLRCHSIRAANLALQPFVAPLRDRWLADREQSAERLRTQAILASREYAFCLYPADALRRLMANGTAAI